MTLFSSQGQLQTARYFAESAFLNKVKSDVGEKPLCHSFQLHCHSEYISQNMEEESQKKSKEPRFELQVVV